RFWGTGRSHTPGHTPCSRLKPLNDSAWASRHRTSSMSIASDLRPMTSPSPGNGQPKRHAKIPFICPRRRIGHASLRTTSPYTL
ncbi:hypothetical protein NDU88_007699, partial [Pleurodeles waltl]